MKNSFDWRSIGKYAGYCIIALFLIVGIPIMINELYKMDCGYIILWDAEDILSFYGTILGTSVSIFVFYRTIKFTLRQIKYEKYIQVEHKKWENIEDLFEIAIEYAQPLSINQIYYSEIYDLENRALFVCTKLIQCIDDTKIKIDNIKRQIDENDLFISKLLKRLQDIVNENEICAKQYSEMLTTYFISRTVSNRDDSAILLFMQLQQSEIKKKVESLHDNDYINLLNLKNDCFKKIYEGIDKNADKILSNKR